MRREPFGYLMSDFAKGVCMCVCARAHPRAPLVCASEMDLGAGKHGRERRGKREGERIPSEEDWTCIPCPALLWSPGAQRPGPGNAG